MDKNEAYRATFYFFERFAGENQDSLIAIILGSMQLLEDGAPADSSIAKDWGEALMRSHIENFESIDDKTAYLTACNLINVFYESNLTKPQELKDLIDRMNQSEERASKYWNEALKRAKTDLESIKLNLS